MVYSMLVIEGNAVYEIDEDCMEKRRERLRLAEQQENEKRQEGNGKGM